MLSLLQQALAISCTGSAFGLSLNHPSLHLPNTATPAANASDSPTVTPGFGELDGLRCSRVGPRLDFSSCENAWRKIPLNSDNLQFRHRYENPPAGTIGLPLRYLSDDGTCAIDVVLAHGPQNFDESTGDTLVADAQTLLEKCVEAKEQGGSFSRVGERHQLTIRINSFSDKINGLSCDPHSSPDVSLMQCENALSKMVTGDKPCTFGRLTGAGIQYPLPRRVSYGKYQHLHQILCRDHLGG